MRSNLYLSKNRFVLFHLEQSPRLVVVERQDLKEQYNLHNNGFLSLLRWMCLQWLFYFHSLEKDCALQRNENLIRIFNPRVWLFKDSATSSVTPLKCCYHRFRWYATLENKTPADMKAFCGQNIEFVYIHAMLHKWMLCAINQ